ncbi:variable large family protein, partial [Borrelia coriaceae]
TFLSSLANLGNDFLNIFTSFGDSFGGVLGFNKDTKKSEVGDYFKKIQETIQGTKDKLNKIVADMKRENNPNVAATEAAVNKLVSEKLDKIINGAKAVSEAIGTTGETPLGDVASASSRGNAGDKVDDIVKGLGEIIEVVLKDDKGKTIGNHEAGDDKKAEDNRSARSSNAGEVGKLFDGTTGPSSTDDKKAANDAAKAVGAVTGADILQAISIGVSGKAAKLAVNNAAHGSLGVTSPKDAEVAGGIALRAMAKGGKFANGSNSVDDAIKGAATSAVTKALNTLTVAIRKTIGTGLKTVKEAMEINPNDTPITSEVSDAIK